MRTARSARWALPILLAAVAAGCPGNRASTSIPAGDRAERDALAPPIVSLLGHRDLLSLTSRQVELLDSIHGTWRAEETRLTRRGTAISVGPMGSSARSVNVAPSGPQARANHRRAGEAVGEILTEEQRRAVCELHRERRQPAHRLWPWCGR